MPKKPAIGVPTTMDWVLISSNKILTPVEFYDIPIPSGYDVFRLMLLNQVVDANGNDNLIGFVSTDGGSTFYGDAVNWDTYSVQNLIPNDGTNKVGWQAGPDTYFAAMRLTRANGQPAVPNTADIRIMPGSSERSFILTSWWDQPVGAWPFLKAAFNVIAIVPPTFARVTTLRVAPEGYFDNPPTSGKTIDSGRWLLWGLPS